ncbi:RES family NAD+ phosphorylase [Mangrovivirga sp. M17]|uniref:RES family NAD+ phosphorylase n=1 Tax=Mangrovivirga halotolerans TaxID=2993936 RepID=A0ABT3RUY4_9BACT|nr:RES family NAD+ phosphorylase [Mangrovivirga halotolerans]MCX2745326.1 RES family NAD+ phosphorylase [Mangrovivirga halotolerans]
MNLKEKLCSECFTDQGLKLLAERIGIENPENCINCSNSNGIKLNIEQIETLAYRFFVVGSIFKPDYGASPIIQFNEHKKTNIKLSKSLQKDIKLFEKELGVGFFHYGPRLWMLGEIEPLKDLQDKKTRKSIFKRIIKEFPTVLLKENELFYRIRINPENPGAENEYDSSPYPGKGRLDSENHQVLYGSQDLEVCIHECRVTVEDEIYVATLTPKKTLKLLDLTELIDEECTEFESLDLSIQMLFLASKHSYEISKELSLYVKDKGFDGIIYPSFFSLVRSGKIPFPTVYGISTRRIPQYKEFEKTCTIWNLALFGSPIKDKTIGVKNINKLVLNRIIYDYQFGPAEIN